MYSNSPLPLNLRSWSVALLALAITGTGAAAQMPRFEMRSKIGAFVPTGDQKDQLKNGLTMGSQAAFNFNRHLAAVGTFTWSKSEDKLTGDADVNVFTYDIGAELSTARALTSSLYLRPFAGMGIGGRSYDYKSGDSDAQHNFAGYGSAGAQLQLGKYGLRFEARDYLSRYKGLSGELADAKTRNDLSFTTGLSLSF